MEYLAHSARHGRPAQTYQRHVKGVRTLAAQYAAEAGAYAPASEKIFQSVVSYAAEFHDLGKLDDENQKTLHGTIDTSEKKHLPVPHQDAGAAWLIQANALLSAFLVKYHHYGLCDLLDESTEDRPFCRTEDALARTRTDRTLTELARRHAQKSILPGTFPEDEIPGDMNVFIRMALSCLADADHTDTALHYGQYPEREDTPELHAWERLEQLDRHIAALSESRDPTADKERSTLRREMYAVCRDSESMGGFSACDSPVGSGKTTAVMAHVLRQALLRGARRIFVILPFTSIISQSVKTYRKYLTLSGENPEKVVAELHFRADFQDKDTRCLTALWRAPIVVTTAVAFFETLASNRPAVLRRLHELPGSMIYMDEAHAALPVRLLPIAWHWMNVLANEWSCYWVLASGSLTRFWELDALQIEHPQVNNLVSKSLHHRLMTYEQQRVSFRRADKPLSRQELISWISASPGPRLLIVNTVQSAAVLANDFRIAAGRKRTEHISTALTAEDREKTIERITNRLADFTDTDWTLIATSCVEAGVDFSFRTGFREISSVLSLLQMAGRVNRHGKNVNAEVWSFALQQNLMLPENKGLQASIAVLSRCLNDEVPITPELSTRAMCDELNENDANLLDASDLLQKENEGAFQVVAKEFVVIDSDTVITIPDAALAEQVRGAKTDWRTIQRRGVSIPRWRAQKLRLKELAPDVFEWNKAYDGFIGYMAGVINP